MKRWILALSCFVLGMGTTLHAQAPLPSPEAALAQAVAQIKPCAPSAEVAPIDKSGNLLSPFKPNTDGKKEAQKVSLPILFRTNRFKLDPLRHSFYQGEKVWQLSFAPKKQDPLPPLRGEDRHYNRAMNNLTGSILIDPKTGSIIWGEARIEKVLHFFGLFRLDSLHFTFVQEKHGEVWWPVKAELTIHGKKGFFWNVHDKHRFTFSCHSGK